MTAGEEFKPLDAMTVAALLDAEQRVDRARAAARHAGSADMRSTAKRLHRWAFALAALLFMALLAAFVVHVIVVHRKQHGHYVAVGMGAQGDELQAAGFGVHGLNSSPMNGVRA